MYFNFLSGQGRAPGDLYMNIQNLQVDDLTNHISPHNFLASPLAVHLAAYTINYGNIDPAMSGFNSENYDQFDLIPYTFAQEQTNGFVGLNPGDPGVYVPDPATLPQAIPVRLKAFPGRQETLTLFTDDSMFFINSTVVSFNYPQFQTINMPTTANLNTSQKCVGFLSDFVQFDLSHVAAANLPKLMVSGKKATHWYESGDNYAMSDDANNSGTGNFEELTLNPSQPLDGSTAPGVNILPPNGQIPTSASGTYDLRQADPTDLTGLSKITSLLGGWRPATGGGPTAAQPLLNLSSTTFDIIIFPNSDESYSENEPADAIAIVHNGNTITNLYAGFAYYTGNGADKPTVRLYPLPSFQSGSVTGEVDYQLSNFTGVGGASTTDEPSIRNGAFTHTTGTLPSGFPNSGTFVVFR